MWSGSEYPWALAFVDRKLPREASIPSVLVNDITVRVAEEQIFTVRDPDRPFRQLKAFRQLEYVGIRPDDAFNGRIILYDLPIHLARCHCEEPVSLCPNLPSLTVGLLQRQRLDAVNDRVGSCLRKSIAAFAAADYVEYGGWTPLSTV